MRSLLKKRIATTLLCLCLLPAIALAETPTYHSEFDFSLGLHADGFPESTPRLKEWESFLQKLSVKGYANTLDFLRPYNRAYFNGGLYVNGVERIPFIFDNYHSYRYFISPAVKNESIHFQMHNFFEFMLKPYYYMGLPTQYLALLLYPDASVYVEESYFLPLLYALAGSGTRNIPYDDLYQLCEKLDPLVNDDPHYERVYFYVTSLLADVGAAESTLNTLGALEDYLDFLDPEQQGMTITMEGGQSTYVLGETTVYTEKRTGDAVACTLALPTQDGYLVTYQYEWTPSASGAALRAEVRVAQDQEGREAESLRIQVDGTGLPCPGDVKAQGQVTFSFGGDTVQTPVPQQTFAFRWGISAPELPYVQTLDIDWLHPQTQKAALTFHYAEELSTVPETVFTEGSYLQEDFFSLNEGSLEEYKERYLPTLVLAALPVVMEMPAGVRDDIVEFATRTGIIDSLGI